MVVINPNGSPYTLQVNGKIVHLLEDKGGWACAEVLTTAEKESLRNYIKNIDSGKVY